MLLDQREGYSQLVYENLNIESETGSIRMEVWVFPRHLGHVEGVYVPPDIVPNRFIHCAGDNLDFSEDPADGRGTLHGIVSDYERV